MHDMFKPVLGRFKDYISTPKPNMYQSLHTTVIGKEGIPFEVQIRTWEMHQIAEYGIAAHWKYKQVWATRSWTARRTYEWVRKLLESQQDTDAEEFVRIHASGSVRRRGVRVHPPAAMWSTCPPGPPPSTLPTPSTPPWATDMTGAKVNGRIVTFDTQLQNGDIVEVITSNAAHGPSRDWMKICKSNEARNKIRQWFKKERREENVATGRAAFESELKHCGPDPDRDHPGRCAAAHSQKGDASARWTTCTPPSATAALTAQKAVIRIRDELPGASTKQQKASGRLSRSCWKRARGSMWPRNPQRRSAK